MFSHYLPQAKNVGSFEFGDKIDVTDPCYDKDVWCRLTVNAKPGTYQCHITKNEEGRVSSIIIRHTDLEESELDSGAAASYVGEIGVDAGLAGFFNDKPDYAANGQWGEVCDAIFADENKGVRHYFNDDGFFSSSGYGDGGYDVYGHECAKDTYDALCIVFI